MTILETMIGAMKFQRGRTLATLDEIAARADAMEAVGWRPGPGRAHIAWQLMHIGITEEIFASERLSPDMKASFAEMWPRFRGGSTPDDEIPSLETIRDVLDQSREHFLEALGRYDDSKLDDFVFVGRNNTEFSLLQTARLIAWHEAHHQGQAHITLNLYKGR